MSDLSPIHGKVGRVEVKVTPPEELSGAELDAWMARMEAEMSRAAREAADRYFYDTQRLVRQADGTYEVELTEEDITP